MAKLVKNLVFTVDIGNEAMSNILTDGMEGPADARGWLKTNPKELTAWLDGVAGVFNNT